jgi:hypothetical protein
MKMVICKNCGVRVLPKSDGTCPSCRALVIGERKTYERPTALERREEQNLAIWKLLGAAWGFYCFTFLMGYGYMAMVFDMPNWPWWPGIVGIGLMLLLTPFFLFYGLAERRVCKVYFCYFLLTSLWPIPLLASIIRLMSLSIIQALIIVGLCVLSICLSYISFDHNRIHAGRLVRQYRWNFTKANNLNKAQEGNQSLVKILILIGTGVGIVLSKIFPRSMPTILSSALLFIIAFYFAAVPGKQLAMMKYVKNLEQEFGKPIKI